MRQGHGNLRLVSGVGALRKLANGASLPNSRLKLESRKGFLKPTRGRCALGLHDLHRREVDEPSGVHDELHEDLAPERWRLGTSRARDDGSIHLEFEVHRSRRIPA